MKNAKLILLLIALFAVFAITSCDVTDFIPLLDEDLSESGGLDYTEHECEYELEILVASTCTENGIEKYVCKICGDRKSNSVPKAEHTVVIDPSSDATESSPAKTEGKHCAVCGYVIVKQEFAFSSEYTNPEKYNGDYAYKTLSTLEKSEKLTILYKMIDEEADYFHLSSIDLEGDGIIASLEYDSLGLSSEEAIGVWSAYKLDHPLYYWMASDITYTSKAIDVKCSEEYYDSETREGLNGKIYGGVKRFVESADSDTAYNTALAFHDLIILACDYAYEADGITPSADVGAHNITGVFATGMGVCEAYAESFQLLLNFCGIENIIVSGYAGEAHAWNMIKLDDGEWYWCDLTWDDTPEFMWGISHRYFCVNDTENVGWIDGPWTVTPDTFIKSHTPYAPNNLGTNFTYTLPARSESAFDAAEIMLRDTFEIDGLTYAVADYSGVQLVSIDKTGEIIIPATVQYKGAIFDVISIGRIEDGLFKTGCIAQTVEDNQKATLNVTSITIPKSVLFIWDDALNINALAEIRVDSENLSFLSIDGVLFNKNATVLIKYPTARPGTSYEIPDTVVIIAAGAFKNFYSNVKLVLSAITLGEATEYAGLANRGYGYGSITEDNVVYDEWNNIVGYLSGDAEIYDSNGEKLT